MEALTALVKANAPKHRPMTLAEVEQAVFDLLKQVGTQLTEEVLTEQIACAEKRGTGRRVAGKKCGGLGCAPEPC